MKTFITDLNLIWGWTDLLGKIVFFLAIILYVIVLISIIGGILSCLYSRFKEYVADMFPVAAVLFVTGTFLFYCTKTEAMQSYQMFQSITSGEYTVYVNGKLTDETKYARLVAMQSMTVDYIIDEDAKEILITERERDRHTLQEQRIDAYWEEFEGNEKEIKMKKIMITLPDEFDHHFSNDKFKDSMGRMLFDLKNRPTDITNLAGRYEIETLEMLETALEESTEIRTGKWMQGTMPHVITCSECGTWFDDSRIKFMPSCPYCKADMENYDTFRNET